MYSAVALILLHHSLIHNLSYPFLLMNNMPAVISSQRWLEMEIINIIDKVICANTLHINLVFPWFNKQVMIILTSFAFGYLSTWFWTEGFGFGYDVPQEINAYNAGLTNFLYYFRICRINWKRRDEIAIFFTIIDKLLSGYNIWNEIHDILQAFI